MFTNYTQKIARLVPKLFPFFTQKEVTVSLSEYYLRLFFAFGKKGCSVEILDLICRVCVSAIAPIVLNSIKTTRKRIKEIITYYYKQYNNIMKNKQRCQCYKESVSAH